MRYKLNIKSLQIVINPVNMYYNKHVQEAIIFDILKMKQHVYIFVDPLNQQYNNNINNIISIFYKRQ